MLPLRDSQPSHKIPIVTISLIVFNVVIFVYQQSLTSLRLYEFLCRYAFTPIGLREAIHAGKFYYPLITSMFLHGGLSHLIGNMWVLWIFGDNVEDYLRPIKFILFYIATGIIAILAHTLAYPNSAVPTLGASGAIAGVMGAYLILYPRAKVLTLIPLMPFFVTIPAPIYLVIWFIIQLVSGFVRGSSGIAWWAHVAGFLGGLVICVGGRNRRKRQKQAAN
ncbi:MAG: rhomboid family intramembrane serine protease [Christensenellales bacterium]|jgi:membrane associated rhomboid family serine protease|nr:rhomboid family intramembrane serine protease [Clostridiaceae bacterium]